MESVVAARSSAFDGIPFARTWSANAHATV
jgi:hypothetical protein